MPEWIRKLVEHAATSLVTAVGMALVSCANTGDLGAIAGAMMGGGETAAVEAGLTKDDLQESLEGAGLVCATDAELQALVDERESFKQAALDCGRDAELLREAVRDQVAAVVEVPAGVTAIGNLVELLIAELTATRARADGAEGLLRKLRADMSQLGLGAGQEDPP